MKFHSYTPCLANNPNFDILGQMCTGNLPTDPTDPDDPDPTNPPQNGNINCGPEYGNKVCGGNDCCSPSGYCVSFDSTSNRLRRLWNEGLTVM